MTRTDFHRNLFYYYRGPVTDRRFTTQQLENNTTKALINVLENAGPLVRGEFLRLLRVSTPSEKLNFALQTETIGELRIRKAKDRLLVGIVGGQDAAETDSSTESATGSSLPDAWIWNEEVAILIENKLGPNLDQDQVARHMNLLGSPARHVPLKWQKIHEAFLGIATERGTIDELLVSQFTKYLEYAGMATSKTIDEELFDYLLRPEDDQARSWVRTKMGVLAEAVKEGIGPDDAMRVKVGNLQKETGGSYSCWVTLARTPRPSAEAHLAIEIFPYELSISANVDTSTISRLFDGLAKRPETLRTRLASLGADFLIAVNDRIPQGPRRFDYVQVMKFRTGRYIADESSFNHMIHLLKALRAPGTYPSFSVTRTFSRHEVLEKKDGLASALIQAARQLQPIVQFINSRGESPQ